MTDDVKSFFAREAEAVKNIPVDDNFNKALDLIFDHLHILKCNLVASGLG